MDSFAKFWNEIEQIKGINDEGKLTPLSQEDMGTTSQEDVANWMHAHGKNTTKLGNQMSDEDLRKFYGQ
jgi:hypothetical protein